MDWVQVGADAAKGAAAGSVVPGIGTALGAAGGVALDLAPELGQWLFGPGSSNTVKAVETAVQTVTGSADVGDQVQALTNPDLARNLRIQLAGIAAARAASAAKAAQDQLVAQLADVANARATTVQLRSSRIADGLGRCHREHRRAHHLRWRNADDALARHSRECRARPQRPSRQPNRDGNERCFLLGRQQRRQRPKGCPYCQPARQLPLTRAQYEYFGRVNSGNALCTCGSVTASTARK